MSYMTISSQENHHFSLCSYFHAHPTTLLLNILGGDQCMGRPPTSNFGGTVPPVPPRSPPLLIPSLFAFHLGLSVNFSIYIYIYMPIYRYIYRYIYMYIIL